MDDPQALPRCYRHADRETGVRCTHCDRPICPDCLRAASVGYWCPECVREAEARQRTPTAPYGGAVVDNAAVTLALLAVNVGAYLLTALNSSAGFANNAGSSMFGRLALWPPVIAVHGEYWRLLTSMFLHYGPIHLAMNMLALVVIGRRMEPIFGRLRYIGLYLLAGLGGSVAVYVFQDPRVATAGASGALYGLMGALFVVIRRIKGDLRSVYAIVGLNLLITFTVPGLSIWAHIGGLVTGVVLAAALVYAPRGPARAAVQVAAFGGVAAILAGAVVLRTGQLLQLIG